MSSATRDHIAPISYYARMVWLVGILILAFAVLIWEVEDPSVRFLFYLSIPFNFAWWVNVREAERPPISHLLPRIALGFVLGLGGLWLLVFLLQSLGQGVFRLWWTPTISPMTLATIGTTGAILIQFGVGMVEEGIFRVGIPRLSTGRGVNAGAIILLSNWAFGMFHWQAYRGDPKGVVIAIFAGLLQSIAYFMSRSAIGVMLGHAIWNLWVAGLLGGFLTLFAWGLIILGIAYYLKLRSRRRQ